MHGQPFAFGAHRQGNAVKAFFGLRGQHLAADHLQARAAEDIAHLLLGSVACLGGILRGGVDIFDTRGLGACQHVDQFGALGFKPQQARVARLQLGQPILRPLVLLRHVVAQQSKGQ